MRKLILALLLFGGAAALLGAGRSTKSPTTNLVLTLDSNRGNNHVDSLSYDSGYVYIDGNLVDYSSFSLRVRVGLPVKGTASIDSFYQTSALSKDTVHLFLYSTLGDTLYFVDSTVLTNLPNKWEKRITKAVGDTLVHNDLVMKYRIIDTTSVIDSTLRANKTWPTRNIPLKYELISKE